MINIKDRQKNMVRQNSPRRRQEQQAKEEVEAELESRDVRIWWALAAVGGIVVSVLTAWLAHRHTLTGINLDVFRFINNWPDSLKPLFIILTLAPSGLLIGAAGVVVTFLLKLYQLSWQLAAAVFTGGAVAYIAKKVIDEPRPYGIVPDVNARIHETDAGFPSGHTIMITILVLTLWPYLPRVWRWVFALTIPAVGISRIYLGVHSGLDIVGGFAMGLTIVAVMRILPDRLKRILRFD